MSKKNEKNQNTETMVEKVETVVEASKTYVKELLVKEASKVEAHLEPDGKYRISPKSVIYKRGKSWTIDTTIDDKNIIGSVLKDDLKGIARTYWVGGEKAYQNKGLVYLSQIVKSLLNIDIDLNHERQLAREFIRLHEAELTFSK